MRSLTATQHRPHPPATHIDRSQLVTELIDGFRSLRPAEALLLHAEANLLARLKEGDRTERLGFVSLSVLAEELLGLKPRTTYERLGLAKALRQSPAAEGAFLDGRITTCQLLAIAPMLERPDADLWIDRASQSPVRILRANVRKARREEAIEEQDEQGRVVSFEAPVAFLSAWNSSLETARKTIGHDVSVYRAIEAVLSETGFAGCGESRRERKRSVRPPSEPERIAVRRVRPHPHAVARAEQTLLELKHVLARLPLVVTDPQLGLGSSESSGTTTADPDCDPFSLLERLQAIRQLRNPLELLRSAILLALRTLGAIEVFGYTRFDAFVEEQLHVSARTARHWIAEAHLYEDWPDLAEACSRGEIAMVPALMIRSMPSASHDAWIERAQQVTVRQFVREIRFHVQLWQVDRKLAVRFRGSFPLPGLEKALARKLCRDHGWSRASLEELLSVRGVEALEPEASADPAENPMLQRRLEVLLEVLAMEGWEEGGCWGEVVPGWGDHPGAEDGLHPVVRQTSAREGRVRIRFWAPRSIAADWAGAIEAIRRRYEQERLPVWAAAVILLQAAVEEWEKEDPKRRPVRSRIIERDGCRCVFPGCRRRCELEGHHGKYRSAGGTDVRENLMTLCAGHHRGVIHKGYGSVRGRAPQRLRWELGRRPGRRPLMRLRGEKIESRDDLKDTGAQG